ncbi:MAG: tRNA (N6-threonylcarbamoyladenosine(37)-N6)-methyltransferase TrmO [Pseudomonadota bacterium]
MAAEPGRWPMDPIGTIRSPFRQKFGIPRQPRLAPVDAEIELFSPLDGPEAVRGLEGFSHLWVVFAFHAAGQGGPTVRPPRLGGRQRLGVLATRSTHRPNGIGLSAVALEAVAPGRLTLGGVDLLDGTPVLDVKPYLPWSDAIPDAAAGFAEEAPPAKPVHFAPAAEAVLAARADGEDLRQRLAAVVALDPRPATGRTQGRVYRMAFADMDVSFAAEGAVLWILSLAPSG